jgi:hypothetical protein
MKTIEQAWCEHGVDDDMPPHDFFVAGWNAAMGERIAQQDGACADQLALAIGTLESRERNIETILKESARRQVEIEQLNLAEEGAKEAFEVVVESKRELEAKVLELQGHIQATNELARKSILSKNELLALLIKINNSNILTLLDNGCVQTEVRTAITKANK